MSCPDGLAKKEVINRAGLKALRIACVLAVSADFHSPQVTMEHAEWAIRFVDAMDAAMLARFTSGEVGSGQTKQEAEIRKAAKAVVKMTVAERRSLGMNKEIAKIADMVPLSVLKDLVVSSAAFVADRSGAVTSFERCVDSMVRSGFFSKVKEDYAVDNFGHTKGVLLCVRG
jgi:hypothetical protein